MKPSSSSSPLSLNLKIRNQKAPDAFPRLTVTLRHSGICQKVGQGVDTWRDYTSGNQCRGHRD